MAGYSIRHTMRRLSPQRTLYCSKAKWSTKQTRASISSEMVRPRGMPSRMPGGDFEGNIPAERVEQDGGHLFVSDTEKSMWNNKAAKDLANVSLEKLFSTNGYYKAPDGILLQWGYNTGGDSTGTITVYFPITFYAVPYCVITTVAFGAKTGVASASVNSKTASYFIARKSYAESAGAHPAGEPIYWFAIGRWK